MAAPTAVRTAANTAASVSRKAAAITASVNFGTSLGASIAPEAIWTSRQDTVPARADRASGIVRSSRITRTGSASVSSALARKVGSLSSSGSRRGCTSSQWLVRTSCTCATAAAYPAIPSRCSLATASCAITRRS